MQNTLSLVKDVRGCMTRFDPLTPEIVADQAEDGLTYDELKEVLEECGMDIEKVIFDVSRSSGLTAAKLTRTMPFPISSYSCADGSFSRSAYCRRR